VTGWVAGSRGVIRTSVCCQCDVSVLSVCCQCDVTHQKDAAGRGGAGQRGKALSLWLRPQGCGSVPSV
jgi:hypothetical protein